MARLFHHFIGPAHLWAASLAHLSALQHIRTSSSSFRNWLQLLWTPSPTDFSTNWLQQQQTPSTAMDSCSNCTMYLCSSRSGSVKTATTYSLLARQTESWESLLKLNLLYILYMRYNLQCTCTLWCEAIAINVINVIWLQVTCFAEGLHVLHLQGALH